MSNRVIRRVVLQSLFVNEDDEGISGLQILQEIPAYLGADIKDVKETCQLLELDGEVVNTELRGSPETFFVRLTAKGRNAYRELEDEDSLSIDILWLLNAIRRGQVQLAKGVHNGSLVGDVISDVTSFLPGASSERVRLCLIDLESDSQVELTHVNGGAVLRASLTTLGRQALKRGLAIAEGSNTRLAQTSVMDTVEPDPRNVFVIHGQNAKAKDALFAFLRSLDLNPLEWGEVLASTSTGIPYIGETVKSGLATAKAIIALFTDDEEVRLRAGLQVEKQGEGGVPVPEPPQYQSRPNVIFEAGMAFSRYPERLIFVELGSLRPFSDISGIHVVRMDDSAKKRLELISRLKTLKCAVKDDNRTDWLETGSFESAVAHPKP